MRKEVSLPLIVGILLFMGLAAIMYQSTFSYLLGKWGVDDFTYSYFIPMVVAYLIWEKRTEFAAEPICRDWAGLLPVTIGILFFWIGELGGEFTIMFISLWLLGFGALWSSLGWRKLRVILFPVMLVLAMIPPPMIFYNGLTLRLKLISSQIGVLMLQLCGLTAYREGNIIDLGFTKLQVVDACSGLRYFFPLIVLGILLAYFFKGALWKKIVIVLSAVPISIVTNSMRIASVGILYQYMGPAAAEGFFHDFSGWFIFMLSLGILLLEMALLKRILPGRNRLDQPELVQVIRFEPSTPRQTSISGLTRIVSPQFLVILLLMAASAASAQGVSDRHRTAMQKPFSIFPDAIGSWSGKKQTMGKMSLDALELNDYLLADFRNSRGELVNCYVAFSDYQSKGKASHSPASCLPGSGWELRSPEKIPVVDASGRSITVNRAMMVMGNERRLTYYWFDQRGRILTDLFQIKLYNFVDSIALNRTDGALVRLITPLGENEPAAAADERLKEFFQQFNTTLGRFLPPAART
ncbi:MAG: VPLPA-CTERM-specific exosortase XrtD [Geobacteraceae bacterium]|nr:VPLPA-CTERM-specific exosortase XrtD [Geobacteraceae bacterium]